jgi:cytochrome P450 PksS
MDSIRGSRLADPSFKADPYPFYARMRQEAPVFRIALPLGIRAWLVTRYDDVVTVLKDERFAKDITRKMDWLPGFGKPLLHHMLNRDPPDHTRLRALVSQAFSPRRIEGLRGRIQAVCDRALDEVAAGGSFDLVRDYALPIPLTVIADLLGIPEDRRLRFHRLTRGSLPMGAPTGLFDVPRSIPYVWLLLRFFRKLFAEVRARPRDDLLTDLVQAEEAGDRLSEDELLGTGVLLLFAGYETTVNLIASGALALLENPDQRARFEQDPEIGDTAVEELLRFTSPVEITPGRVTREPVELGGVTLPAGAFVAAVLGSANHDETRFRRPEELDLGRDPNRHVAFGQGAHFCLGATLAHMEGRIALTTLLRRFPALRLAQPVRALRWRRTLPLRGLEALPVTAASPP